MKLLANENFPLKSFDILKKAGYDIEHIGQSDPSVRDEVVMKKAIRENRIIITFDRDYGALVFLHEYQPPAVIYLRFADFLPEMPGEFLLKLLKREDLEINGYFTVADEHRIRQRKIAK